MPSGVTPHSIIIDEAGVSIVGGVVSFTVIIWFLDLVLPQSSVAVQVLLIFSVLPQLAYDVSL